MSSRPIRHARRSRAALIGTALLLAGLVPIGAPAMVLGAPTELFISEYIEGSSNNKAIEIYNRTGAPVNLGTGEYKLQMAFNGNPAPTLTIPLTGTVGDGDVHVVAQASADPAILAQADQTNGAGWFNGDDAVLLVKGATNVVVDSIGQAGFDPGTEWGTGVTSTADNTLRRKLAIETGDTNPADAFDPAVDWDGFDINDFSDLGGHPVEPEPPVGGECGDPATPIHEIQGAGTTSPLPNNTAVEIEGVVVGDYQASTSFNGFHVQEEDGQADTDAATSEGIFVFEGGSAVDVAPGDIVRVAGQVVEFASGTITLTEITNVTAVLVCSSGASVTPAAVALPFESTGFPERYEGMLVDIEQTLTVTETFTLARFGEVVLASGGRLFNPTSVAEPGSAAQAVQAANDRNRIVLDDGDNRQNIDPTLYPQGGLSASNTLRIGDTLAGGAFVLEQRFSLYRLQPTDAVAFGHDNQRPVAPEAVGGNLRVSAMNVLNYFDTLDLGPDICGPAMNLECRGADSALELERQRVKIVSALIGLDADIVGLMEIENDAGDAVADLVSALNAELGAPTYDYIDTGTIGTDAIKLAIIYRTASVVPVGGHAILDSSVDPRFRDTLNRPSLAQTFEQAGGGGRLTVVVNHLKSKGSDCNAVGDPDTGDGSGNCNVTRTLAAEALVDWIATDPTGSGDRDAIVIGDLNSYARENPIDVFVDAGYTNLIEEFVGDDAYSFVFQGQSGYLDHALATPTLAAQVTGATEWHVNADEPIALDYNTEFKSPNHVNTLFAPDQYRSADHDPVLVGIDLLDYDFALRSPFVAPPAFNRWIAPVPVPLLFTLDGNHGRSVLFGSALTRPIDCTTGAPIGDPVNARALAGLVYNRRFDTYTYLWRTERSWAGTCRTLELPFDDGTTGIAWFRFLAR